MKSFKLNLDMNIVNCVLLFVMLILVLLFCNKQNEKYTDYIEKSLDPDCNNISPCSGIEFQNKDALTKCRKNKFLYPLDIAREEFNKPFKSGISSVRAYLYNNKFKDEPKENINKKLDNYMAKIENKSCRKKTDSFCKLRFGDRYEINPSLQKIYKVECGQDTQTSWKYNTNELGDEILIDNNGSSGSHCSAPYGKKCG